MNIAEERIDRLHAFARKAASDRDYDCAREYVRLACRVVEWDCCGLPRVLRRFSCDDCDAYLHPGVNAHVRTHTSDHVVVRCDYGTTKRCPC